MRGYFFPQMARICTEDDGYNIGIQKKCVMKTGSSNANIEYDCSENGYWLGCVVIFSHRWHRLAQRTLDIIYNIGIQKKCVMKTR
jgi:hypothetical protein